MYLPKFREWGLALSGVPAALQVISHCPWCGEALPPSLRAGWFDRLDELELEPESPDVPLHTRNDAWWRARLRDS